MINLYKSLIKIRKRISEGFLKRKINDDIY